MSITKKIIATIILVCMIFSSIAPVVDAAVDNTTLFKTEEDILYEQNKDTKIDQTQQNKDETYAKDNEEKITSFDVLMADVLTKKEGESFNLNDIPSIILQKPSKNGVWIEESSREYVINLINETTNKTYKIDEDGFLVEDKNAPKKIINDEFKVFTQKIDTLLSNEKLIIIAITDSYKELNKTDNEMINIKIDDNDYELQFKDNTDEKQNKEDIILLNEKYYTFENSKDTKNLLMYKFLENYDFENIEELEENNVGTEQIKKNNVKSMNISKDIKHISQDNIFDDRVSEDDFNLILSGILSNKVDITNMDTILENQPKKTGIWIEENSRTSFVNFINEHTIYTYSVDSDGYLMCDNIMKDNPNLDILEKSETEFDIEYRNLILQESTIIVRITNNYLQYDEENNIITTEINSDEYVKTFSNDNRRIVLLNNIFYSNANYDLALSDFFVKSLQNIQEKVITGELSFEKTVPNLKKKPDATIMSDTSKPGTMLSAQNVYAGPNSSDYFKVGSVSNGEMVYLLGQQAGWYHIQYMITGSSNQKSGFVPVSTVSNNYSVHEEQMTGGQRYPQQGLQVKSCDDFSIAVNVGSVFAGEGVTVLYDYGYSDSSKSYRVAYIEFSTSSGTKRGYVYNDQLDNASYATSVARVTATNPAYSGPDTSYVKLGGAYYNEFVSILEKEGDWVFVEYNTRSGRKRGFMSYSNLSNYNHPGWYNDFATNQGIRKANQQLNVYGGPNSNNAKIGLIYNNEIVSLYNSERGYAYIEYTTTRGAKRGYVLASELSTATAPSLPNIPTYSGFSSGTYGTSGLGQSLKYYKIGSGPNIAFAVFAQHGWEDAWAYDGIELVNIANRVMSDLSSSGINSNWSLYIIPYANPDGITDGYSNNGPGRCTVTTKIDMNRSWPANFSPYYSSRNYTGNNPLGAPETVALKNFILNRIGTGDNIVLDIHGWLNQTYGDYSVAKYFDNQFGYGNSNTWGKGYLETWGKSIGAKSALIELPMPTSSADIINRNFSGKLSNGIKNMLNNISVVEEGGSVVNEQVEVISSGNLNVRSGPGTSYSKVATLSPGSVVTRIKRSVATANGYVWDKIRLTNGTEGYVATNYLAITSSSSYLVDGKKFIKNKTYSSHDSEYNNKKSTNDELWNTMSATEKALKNSRMNSDWNRLKQAAQDYSGMYDLGSEALDYFLSNEGNSHNLGDIRTLFIIPNQAEIEYTYLNRNMKAAEYFTNTNSSFALDYEYDLKVGDYADMIDTLLAAEAGDYLSQIKVDWFIAAHCFKMGTYSTVEKTGNTYKMYTNFNMADYYDWDDGFMCFPLNQDLTDVSSYINESNIKDLHEAGKAKNFESQGKITVYVEWQAGQTAEQATVHIL